LSQRLLSILSGIKVIKAFQGQELEESAFSIETGKYFRRHMKVVWNAVLSKATSELLNPILGFSIIGFGVWLMINEMWGITIGTLVQVAMIMVMVYKPIKALSTSFPKIMESTGSAARLFTLLDMDEEPADRPDARPMTGLAHHIHFKDVYFDYGDEPVLCGIDLEVRAGEVIALVGRSGTGKSTLVDLVLRFHDPTRGSIEIDGVDLRDIQRQSFLDHVAVVTQEPFLFDETVFENIRYGRPDATAAEVHAAAEAASAAEFIDELPEGYDTPVGEFGLRLSGGQRQRLTIARAILANPAILVFDEATSALDAKTERAVQAAIESLRGERTIFLVAHRLSTIRHADRIVVLDRGRIAEIGNHVSLMSHPGIYHELIGIQETSAT
jgi:subfamily B ATP-binding cassette protein MsbA